MRGRGISGTIMNIIKIILITALVLAILRQFGFDIIEVFIWIGDFFVRAVERIADWFAGQRGFQEAVH